MELLDLARAELAAHPIAIPTWHVGDQVRVLRHDLPLAAHVGDVGTVVAVMPLHGQPGGSMVVHLHAARQAVLVDFGPDEDRAGGRDTWSYADVDVVCADELAPAPPKRKTQRATRKGTKTR